MGRPTPPKEVKRAFKYDMKNKARVAGIAGVALLLVAFAFFLRKRSRVENPVKNLQAQAVADTGNGQAQQALQVDQRQGVTDAAAVEGGATFYDRTISGLNEELQQQENAKRQAEEEARAKQIEEAREQALRQARGEVPATVRADGTAGPSNAPEGQQAPDPRLQVPPEHPYDLREWIRTPDGTRIRPGYQTNALYPADPGQHQQLEQEWFNSFAAPTTVGLAEGQAAVQRRLVEDFGGVDGSVGVRRRPRLPQGKANVPAPRRPVGAGSFGDWITVTPVPPPVRGGK